MNKQSVPAITNERLLTACEVEERSSLSRSTIWRQVQSGQFPRPIRIGARRVAWRESDVAQWIDSRCAARDLSCS